MNALLRLAKGDPVAVAVRDIEAHERVTVDDIQLTLLVRVPLGYKVAILPIKAGDKVLKYQVPIGVATRDIAPGEIVHTHNLRSDYLPTFTLQAGQRFEEDVT